MLVQLFSIFTFSLGVISCGGCDASRYNYLIGNKFDENTKCFLGTGACVGDLYDNRLVMKVSQVGNAYPGRDRLNVVYDDSSKSVVDVYCK
jgi:hypothetical protein